MHSHKELNQRSYLFPGDDPVHKSVLKLKLRPLKALGKLLVYGLFNDSWTCKSYKGTGFRKDDISKICKACTYSPCGGIC